MDKKKKFNCILSSILLILFLIITVLVVTNNINWFDDTIYNALISLRNKPLDVFFKTITRLGDTLVILIIVVVMRLLRLQV